MKPENFFGMTNDFGKVLTEKFYNEMKREGRVQFIETKNRYTLKINAAFTSDCFHLWVNKRYVVLTRSGGFLGYADSLNEAEKLANEENPFTSSYVWKDGKIHAAFLYKKPKNKNNYKWFYNKKEDHLILRKYDAKGGYEDAALTLYHTTLGTGTAERGYMVRNGSVYYKATKEIIEQWKNRKNLPKYKGNYTYQDYNQCAYLYNTDFPKISNGYEY